MSKPTATASPITFNSTVTNPQGIVVKRFSGNFQYTPGTNGSQTSTYILEDQAVTISITTINGTTVQFTLPLGPQPKFDGTYSPGPPEKIQGTCTYGGGVGDEDTWTAEAGPGEPPNGD